MGNVTDIIKGLSILLGIGKTNVYTVNGKIYARCYLTDESILKLESLNWLYDRKTNEIYYLTG